VVFAEVDFSKGGQVEDQTRIGIDFERNIEDPARVFRSAADLIDAFQSFDAALLRPLGREVEFAYLLQDIKEGSMVAWLTSKIKGMSDDSLEKGDWKAAIGPFLLATKQQLLVWLKDQHTIDRKEQFDQLEAMTIEIATSTKMATLLPYVAPSIGDFAQTLNRIKSATDELAPNDIAFIEYKDQRVTIPRTFEINHNAIREILSVQTYKSKMRAIVAVKKPDFLGRSKWLLRMHGHAIEASIEDLRWLEAFQERNIIVLPGDSIDADIESEIDYDKFGQIVHQYHRVLIVHRVLSQPGIIQNQIGL
jgi:hypothetical protein